MKIKIPGRKKNNRDIDETKDTVFDLTGSAAERPDRKTSFALIPEDDDSFEVNVRNEEPIIRKIGKDRHEPFLKNDIQVNIAAAAAVTAILALFLSAAELSELIFFVVPGLLVFALIALFELIGKEKIKLVLAAAIMLALIAALFMFRGQITSGIALIMNQFYDEAELAQAYLYKRMNVGAAGDDDPYNCMHMATMWISAIFYLVAALPSASFKRAEVPGLAAIAMLMFAYYGLIPAWMFLALLAAALILALSRGSLLSTVIVLLVTMIAFGAVIMADPGENYGISRADENFRDRFALKSAYLQSGDAEVDNLDTLQQDIQNKQEQDREEDSSGFMSGHKGTFALLIAAAILAALAAAALLCIRWIRRRQAENRAGIDSDDPKEAITAMFPYSVKWLQLAGLEPQGKPFTALMPAIRADISENYGERFSGMYDLWQEAAYSDHEMTEEDRAEMDLFMNDTIDMMREESSLRSKVVNTFRYAL